MCNHAIGPCTSRHTSTSKDERQSSERGFLDLPDELLEKIFSSLGNSLDKVAQVCSRFAAIARRDTTWEKNCERFSPSLFDAISSGKHVKLAGGWKCIYKLVSRCPIRKCKRARYTELQCGEEPVAKRAKGEFCDGHMNHVDFYKISTRNAWGCEKTNAEDILLCSPACGSHTSWNGTTLLAFRGYVANFSRSNLKHKMLKTSTSWSLSCPWCSASAAEATVCFGGRVLAALLPNNYEIQDGWYLVTICRNGHVMGTFEECLNGSDNSDVSSQVYEPEGTVCG